MDNIIQFSGDANQLVFGLIFAIIISVFINLFFLNKNFVTKIRDARLQAKLPKLIQEHLSTQANRTQNSKKTLDIPALHDLVIKFRSAYLQIESKSIDRGIDSESYWNIINSKINKLLEIVANHNSSQALLQIKAKIDAIKNTIKKSPDQESKKKIFECLDSFYRNCKLNSDSKTLQMYNKKLNRILLTFTNRDYAKLSKLSSVHQNYSASSKDTINQLREHVATSARLPENLDVNSDKDIGEHIEKYNNNSALLTEGIGAYSDNIDTIQNKIESITRNQAVILSSENIRTTNNELSELSQQILEANEQEITRLRSIVKDQKSTIYVLEDEIRKAPQVSEKAAPCTNTDTETDTSKKKPDPADVERLKRSLFEAEDCITVLESEMEKLRQKTAEHKTLANQNSDSEHPVITDDDIQELQKTITGLKSEVDQSKDENELLASVSKFAIESFSGATFEDVSLLLYQTLEDMGAEAALVIYGPARTFEICESGRIPLRVTAILNNMQANEHNAGQNNSSLFFRYRNFDGALKPKNRTSFSQDQICQILRVAGLANNVLDHTKLLQASKNQHKRLSESSNLIKKAAADLDSTLKNITRNAISTLEDSFGQIQDIARSSGMNASQAARLKDMESGALEDLKGDQHLRLKTKKIFLEILSQLERLDEH